MSRDKGRGNTTLGQCTKAMLVFNNRQPFAQPQVVRRRGELRAGFAVFSSSKNERFVGSNLVQAKLAGNNGEVPCRLREKLAIRQREKGNTKRATFS